MAYIPFGYRIHQGRAEIVDEDAEKLRILFQTYTQGGSVREAAQRAGLSLNERQARDMLEKAVYLGDAFYPQIIDRNLFDDVQKERERRRKEQHHVPSRKPKEKKKPADRFQFDMQGFKEESLKTDGSPSTITSLLYGKIVASEEGSEHLPKSVENEITEWLNTMSTNQNREPAEGK